MQNQLNAKAARPLYNGVAVSPDLLNFISVL